MSLTSDDKIINRLPGFCSCGREMTKSGSGLVCDNCDFPQPQEIRCADCGKPGECESKPGKRVMTDRDWAFEKVWRQRILVLFGRS